MSNEEKKNVTEKEMEEVAGGDFTDILRPFVKPFPIPTPDPKPQIPFDPGNGYGVRCPKCGSSNIVLSLEHDEVGVFDCKYCGNHFTKRYGE